MQAKLRAHGGPSMSRRLVREDGAHWLAWLALGFGFYMLLSDTYSIPEFVVGLGAAAMGATAATVLRHTREVRVRADTRLWYELRRVPARAVTDSLRVLAVLLSSLARGRHVAGRVRAVEINLGGDTPWWSARRAAQDYAVCATPMTLSFGFDHEHNVLLIHELQLGEGPSPGPVVRL